MGFKFVCNDETAIVETTKGTIRGYEYGNINIFKGIPYAKAKRFHAPEPMEPWDGILEVTSYGYVCPLLSIEKPKGELNVPHRFWVMNEECQNLNVWTPALDNRKRAVIVWLHGGGYEAGSAIEHEAYDGENMCRLGDVVVVSVNHRLNVLGYCDLSAFGEEYENSGNAGTDDLIMSLKWVNENIARFGGNPDNVTIMGQSGGGGKVTTLLQTPAADGLYKQGINMSGAVGLLLTDSVGSGKKLGVELMNELEINTIQELETIPWELLSKAYQKVKTKLEAAGENVGGSPHPNKYYMGSPERVGFRKETAHIPLLLGTVYGEFTAFMTKSQNKNKMTEKEEMQEIENFFGEDNVNTLLPLFKEAYPMRHIVDMLSLDFMFRPQVIEYVKKRSALNESTFVYFFNEDSQLDYGRVPWHCYDIPFVFHNTAMLPAAQGGEFTEKIEDEMFETFICFAKTGNPNNCKIPTWHHSTPTKEYTMFFEGNTHEVINHDRELLPKYVKIMEPLFTKMMAESNGQLQH